MKKFKIFISYFFIFSFCLMNVFAGYKGFEEAAELFENQDFQGATPRMLTLAREGNLHVIGHLFFLESKGHLDDTQKTQFYNLPHYRFLSQDKGEDFENFKQALMADFMVSRIWMTIRYRDSLDQALRVQSNKIIPNLIKAATEDHCGRAYFLLSQILSEIPTSGREILKREDEQDFEEFQALRQSFQTYIQRKHIILGDIDKFPLLHGYLNPKAIGPLLRYKLHVLKTPGLQEPTLPELISIYHTLGAVPRLKEATAVVFGNKIWEDIKFKYRNAAYEDQKFYSYVLNNIPEYCFSSLYAPLYRNGAMLGDARCMYALTVYDATPQFKQFWSELKDVLPLIEDDPISWLNQGLSLYIKWHAEKDPATRRDFLLEISSYLEKFKRKFENVSFPAVTEFNRNHDESLLFFTFYANMASMLLAQDNEGCMIPWEDAIEYLDKAEVMATKFETHPRRASFHYLKGRILRKKDNFKSAAQIFEEAYTLGHHPSFQSWIEALAHANMLDDAFLKGNGIAHLKTYMNYLESLGKTLFNTLDPTAISLLAEFFIRKQQDPEKLGLPPLEDWAKAAEQKNQDNGLLILHLYYYATGQREQCAKIEPLLLEQLLGLKPEEVINRYKGFPEALQAHIIGRNLEEVKLDTVRYVLYSLGRQYFEKGVIPKALTLIEASALLGDYYAMDVMGQLYKYGAAEVERNIDLAIEFLRKAVLADEKQIYQNLGACLFEKAKSIKNNKEKRKALFKESNDFLIQAAKKGDRESALHLLINSILQNFHYLLNMRKGKDQESQEYKQVTEDMKKSVQTIMSTLQKLIIDNKAEKSDKKRKSSLFLYEFALMYPDIFIEDLQEQWIHLTQHLSLEEKETVNQRLRSSELSPASSSDTAIASPSGTHIEGLNEGEIDDEATGIDEETLEETYSTNRQDMLPGQSAAASSSSQPGEAKETDILNSLIREMPGLENPKIREVVGDFLHFGWKHMRDFEDLKNLMCNLMGEEFRFTSHPPHHERDITGQQRNRSLSALQTIKEQIGKAGITVKEAQRLL